MRRLYNTLLGFSLIFIFIISGSCRFAIVPTPPTPTTSADITPLKPPWQQEWEKTLAAARQEGKVVIYTTAGTSQTAALRQGFERTYEITLEFVSGRGAELREKLFRERLAGLYLTDIFGMMGGTGMVSDLKPVGALDPLKPQLVLPEVVDPNAWWGGSHIYLDKEQTYVIAFVFHAVPPIAINSDLVKPDDIKFYKDLLHPRWKGKIVLNDPTTTGAGQTWFQAVSRSLGYEFMRELAKQESVIIRDLRQQTEWVARGKYAILVGPHKPAVAEFIIAGAPIKYLWPSDGGYASPGEGTMSLVNRPAHPNAAKVFINWLLTKEGQTIFSKASLLPSARLDVPTDHLDPQMIIVYKPGVVYKNSQDEDIVLERDSDVKEAASIFGLATR